MLSNIAPEYFLHTELETANGVEPTMSEVKASKSINPYAFAEFLISAPAEALALANITTALSSIEKMSNRVVEPSFDTVDFYEVSHMMQAKVSDVVTFETVTIQYMHEWNGEFGVVWDRNTKHWILEGVIAIQKNKAEIEYFFLTKELEDWLSVPNKKKRAEALKAICS
jgi:hypothetical protein